MFTIGTRVIASRFTIIGNTSYETQEFGTVVAVVGLGYLVRFDRDGRKAGVFPSEMIAL